MSEIPSPTSNPSMDEQKCTVCDEPLDEYIDCLESDSGKHITPDDDLKYRAALEREAERIRIRRAWVLR